MKQIELPLKGEPRRVDPEPRLREPVLWLARLLLLRRPDLSEDSVIRDIQLRRGLNILWAPPSQGPGESRLFDGRLTGHTAGKTTFCRLIRYLLGEERFGTTRAQERIRQRVPEGWVLGEVFLRGERWVVGRPFALGIHPFASPKVSVEEALALRGPYQEFLSALEASIVDPIPIKTLPHAKRPFDWPLLLTWLSRDQEARFANLVSFRDPMSESASPSPPVGERYAVLRAVLGLLSEEEAMILGRSEALADQRKQLEASLLVLRSREAEDHRRLSKLLGLSEEERAVGPLFAAREGTALAERRAALDRAASALKDKKAAEEEARRAFEQAAEERGASRARLEELGAALRRERALLDKLEAPEKPDVEEAALVAPREAAPGYCSVPLALAEARGCPLALGARAKGEAHAEGWRAVSDAERVREVMAALEQEQAAALSAAEAAKAGQEKLHDRYTRLTTALERAKDKVAEERAALLELERLKGYMKDAADALRKSEAEVTEGAKEAQKLAERRAAQKREQAEAVERLSERFRYVVQALLGRAVGGGVELASGQIALRVDDHGEREGAAMETIKILAFDLAALTLGIEGKASFPSFLLHDGPREADMDQVIYERLFLYAVDELEEAFREEGEPAFQYIVTTTAPPPRKLSRAPWVRAPKLDASAPEGRLFKMDL